MIDDSHSIPYVPVFLSEPTIKIASMVDRGDSSADVRYRLSESRKVCPRVSTLQAIVTLTAYFAGIYRPS